MACTRSTHSLCSASPMPSPSLLPGGKQTWRTLSSNRPPQRAPARRPRPPRGLSRSERERRTSRATSRALRGEPPIPEAPIRESHERFVGSQHRARGTEFDGGGNLCQEWSRGRGSQDHLPLLSRQRASILRPPVSLQEAQDLVFLRSRKERLGSYPASQVLGKGPRSSRGWPWSGRPSLGNQRKRLELKFNTRTRTQ